ncbi:MAG: squalene/phytoene synthase family protein, partial [Acidimicrobiia bacterium]|nr:squalene/phytoene synthase family protein [Acidimicrobiia bacterium]
RDNPDLERLRRTQDPEAFVWAILPYAARSFAPSIVMLPAHQALVAAVGYLYCRMLDSYEDLSAPGAAAGSLKRFADRMTSMADPPPVPATGDPAEQSHVLLLERHELVDRVYTTLPSADQARIAALVRAMADGMVWSAERLEQQGGVLVDAEQVSRYCHGVIGEPVLFTLLLIGERDLTETQRQDALASSELIQLANITRDVERDLARGVAYHPSLLPHLGLGGAEDVVRLARRSLMAQALPNVTSFARLARQLPTGRISTARAAALIMLLYTDRHYRWCARRVGLAGWSGPRRTASIVAASLPAVLSKRWMNRTIRRVERNFLATARAI